MNRVPMLLLAVALAGCQAATPIAGPAEGEAREAATRGPMRVRGALPPGIAKLYAPLAHEGGIAWLVPVSSITNEAKQDAAALLGAELAAELRATRAMSDAALIAGDVATAPGASAGVAATGEAYALAQLEPGRPGPGPRHDEEPWFHQVGAPGVGPRPPRDRFHEFERAQFGAAATAWRGLSPEERRTALDRHGEREQRLDERAEPRLAQRRARFAPQGAEEVVATADGGKTVAQTFRFIAPDGERTVRVTRAFDAQGGLVQVVESLTGISDGVVVDCERVRTFKADGDVVIASDLRLDFGEGVHNVHWAKLADPAGALAGEGSIDRPDGTSVRLLATAAAAFVETITGEDPSGVTVKVEVDAAASALRATLDAGADGKAAIYIGVDVGE